MFPRSIPQTGKTPKADAGKAFGTAEEWERYLGENMMMLNNASQHVLPEDGVPNLEALTARSAAMRAIPNLLESVTAIGPNIRKFLSP